jgi:hypothetical protein
MAKRENVLGMGKHLTTENTEYTSSVINSVHSLCSVNPKGFPLKILNARRIKMRINRIE